MADILADFNEREKAFEKKFQREEELRFKTRAVAAKLFGLWAAEQLGMSGSRAEAYAEKILELGVEGGEIVPRVQKDFQAKDIQTDQRQLYGQFNAKLEQAQRKMLN